MIAVCWMKKYLWQNLKQLDINEERDVYKRQMFARISVSMLEPDLVIMDEFQRFKFLLSSDDSELGILAHLSLIHILTQTKKNNFD